MSRTNRAGLRQAIIDASLQLGSELGEDGLTMRGIASRHRTPFFSALRAYAAMRFSGDAN